MRELRFIPDAGGDGGLVFADADGARFRAPLDEALRAAIAGAPADAPDAAPADEPDAAADAASASADAATPPDRPAIAAVRDDRPARRLRPREIQDRVRAGESVRDIVADTGMDPRQVEPFAWPVLGERHRIAELGRAAHPQRSDGPAPLTLAEVVATAFAARDLDPAAARWDARRDPAGQWIVSVAWSAGLSDNVAEWSFHPASAGESTAVARNALAAELVDPDHYGATPFGARREEIADSGDDDGEVPEEFLRHPDDEPRRRRRTTVMPSWEDVLLGVRPTDRK